MYSHLMTLITMKQKDLSLLSQLSLKLWHKSLLRTNLSNDMLLLGIRTKIKLWSTHLFEHYLFY